MVSPQRISFKGLSLGTMFPYLDYSDLKVELGYSIYTDMHSLYNKNIHTASNYTDSIFYYC